MMCDDVASSFLDLELDDGRVSHDTCSSRRPPRPPSSMPQRPLSLSGDMMCDVGASYFLDDGVSHDTCSSVASSFLDEDGASHTCSSRRPPSSMPQRPLSLSG